MASRSTCYNRGAAAALALDTCGAAAALAISNGGPAAAPALVQALLYPR